MRTPAALILILACASPAAAADIGGALMLQHLGAEDTLLADGDVVARFRFGGSALDGRIGLGLSLDGDRSASYPSAGLAFPFAAVDVGRPRSILDDGPLPEQAVTGIASIRAVLRPLAVEAALSDELGAGLRVEGAAGALSYGTSVHRTESADRDPVVGVAGRYDLDTVPLFDRVAVYGGAESQGAEDRFRLGTELTRGPATAAFDVVVAEGETEATMGQFHLGITFGEALRLGVSGTRDFAETATDRDTRYGLDARYRTGESTFVSGGIDGLTSEDRGFDFAIGFQF